jgi:hypothetical protein
MSFACAPAQLPIAPRPVRSEVLSSWLLRVASGNCISLRELLEAVESSYPEALAIQSLDLSIPPLFLRALARLCRVPVRTLQALDLQRRLPHLETALLLRFPGDDPFSSRRKDCRVGYSFCPLCIANQDVVHVRWEWCFASIIRCTVHRIPLQVACPVCSESDPLSFDRPDLKPCRTCWACGASLVDPTENCSYLRGYEPVIRAVEDAYKAALLGIAPNPSLVGKATDGAFRRFVDDMLQLLICFPQHDSDPTNKIDNTAPLRPRQIPFVMISELIANAAPGSDTWESQLHYRRSLKIWAELFHFFDEIDASALQDASRNWPPALQRRFASALRIRTRKRWPYNRFRSMTVCPGFKRCEAIVVRDLNAGNPPLF